MFFFSHFTLFFLFFFFFYFFYFFYFFIFLLSVFFSLFFSVNCTFSGHVRDLPKAGSDFENRSELKKIIVLPELKINVADLGVDVRNNFEPVYVPLEGKLETLKRLKKLSEQCSRILLATGEKSFYYILLSFL